MKYWILALSLLMFGCGGGESGDSEDAAAGDVVEATQEAASDAAEAVEESAESVGDAAADAINEVQDAAEAVGDVLEESKEEIDEALEEGVRIDYLTQPVALHEDRGDGARRRIHQVDLRREGVAEEAGDAQGHVDARPVEHRQRQDLEAGDAA